LEKDVSYLSNYLYVPKSKVYYKVLRYSLIIGDMPSDAELVGEHVRLPREFMKPIDPWIDLRPSWPELPIGSKTILREDQQQALLSMAAHGCGILNLGCGHGKTVVALNYIATLKKKALVIVNRVNLISQWADEISTHLDIPKDKVGVVQGKKWEYLDKYVVLASINTLCVAENVPNDFADMFGVVIFDECHHLSAPMFKKVCPMFQGERHGLSATPKREDGYERAFEYHIGPVHFSNISQDLVPTISFIKTGVEEEDVSDECKDVKGEIHHRKLCAWLGTIEKRNNLIVDNIKNMLAQGHKILCLTHSVQHIKHMQELVPESGIACGDIPAEERKSNISNSRVSFATVDVAAEALNVPELSCLIILTPFGAKTHGNVLQQALGRIQRKHAEKNKPVALFMSDGIFMCNALLRQCKKRLKEWGYVYEE
jgi:superfamily II DNA or RNA helicase